MSEELSAKEIKKQLLDKRTEPAKPVEPCEFAGVKGWLWRCNSLQMNGWRDYVNHEDPEQSRLSDAKLVQISFRDKQGDYVFTEKGLSIIAGFDDGDVRPIVNAALRINGYSAEGLEAIVKNLVATIGADGLYEKLQTMGYQCPVCSTSTANTSSESST